MQQRVDGCSGFPRSSEATTSVTKLFSVGLPSAVEDEGFGDDRADSLGQRHGAPAGAQRTTVTAEQLCQRGGAGAGRVEVGTVGDHGGPSAGAVRSW